MNMEDVLRRQNLASISRQVSPASLLVISASKFARERWWTNQA
jgi:hypothetical protein